MINGKICATRYSSEEQILNMGFRRISVMNKNVSITARLKFWFDSKA